MLDALLRHWVNHVGYRYARSSLAWAASRHLLQNQPDHVRHCSPPGEINLDGLPNILLQHSVVPEKIQSQCTPATLREAVLALHDGAGFGAPSKDQLEHFQALAKELRTALPASQQVAASILAGI